MKPWKNTFVNPLYPMSNRNTRADQTWGGAHPRLRPTWWYPDLFLPRVLPDRPGHVGTTKIESTIQRVDLNEASQVSGKSRRFFFDPPEYRFFKGDWQEKIDKISEVSYFPNPHPLHRVMRKFWDDPDGQTALRKHIVPAGDGDLFPEQSTVDPEVFSRAVKQFAYDFGAEAAGITKLNRDWVYQVDGKDPLPVVYTHVIVVAVRIPHWRMGHSPSYSSDVGSSVAYHHTAFIAVEIADWIRALGFHAKANDYLTGYDIMMPPVEIEAGLGEQCRIGVTLHPVLGPGFKSAAVLTSLPLVPDRPIEFDLESFCEKCQKCARECPPGAIPKGQGRKLKTRGVTKWLADPLKCMAYWRLNNRCDFPGAHSACARCIYVCPWTKVNTEKWPHRLAVAMVSNFPWIQRFAIKMDDIAGYGKGFRTDSSWEQWC